jgi:antitoxin Phd
MPAWRVQDANAPFGKLSDVGSAQGPQVVAPRVSEAAVLVPITEWPRLHALARPSLTRLRLSDAACTETPSPEPGVLRRRPPVHLEAKASPKESR